MLLRSERQTPWILYLALARWNWSIIIKILCILAKTICSCIILLKTEVGNHAYCNMCPQFPSSLKTGTHLWVCPLPPTYLQSSSINFPILQTPSGFCGLSTRFLGAWATIILGSSRDDFSCLSYWINKENIYRCWEEAQLAWYKIQKKHMHSDHSKLSRLW